MYSGRHFTSFYRDAIFYRNLIFFSLFRSVVLLLVCRKNAFQYNEITLRFAELTYR